MSGKVSCLGPEGSYSALAAMRLSEGKEIVLCRKFPEVFEKLVSGEVQEAVIPIENSIQGGVLENLDLLEREPVFADAQTVLPIDHRLAFKKGVPLFDIERVYSHEQAIGQCSEFLGKYLPNAQCIFTDSTAKSLQMVGDRAAGIVGAHVSAEGIELSAQNIANEKCNYTQFFRLKRKAGTLPQHSKTVFFCAVCEHRPGALLELLRIFAKNNLNLTRIESRPIRNVLGEYRFFICIDGDCSNSAVVSALGEAERMCRQFRILGAY